MKRSLLTTIFGLTLFFFGNLSAQPSVVLIEGKLSSNDEKSRNEALGFIVEKEGFLLTNYQNLLDPQTQSLLPLLIVSFDGESYSADIIGVEPTIGIAILKISRKGGFPESSLLRTADLKVGQTISAFSGFKDGKPQPVTGTITALNSKDCYQEVLAATMVKTNLPLKPEKAGGPIFDSTTNKVIAIHTGFVPQKAAEHVEENEAETHVLPIRLCLNIYQSIKLKKSLKSPWTGFSVRPLNEKEKGFFPTAQKHKGAVAIEAVWPKSPAQKMGIKEGDLLVQFSHYPIESVADFQKWLYMYGVGETVKLTIFRDGKDYLVSDYLIEERPAWAKPK